jgi:hypothetical protein
MPVIGFGEADPPEPHRFVIRHSFLIGHSSVVIRHSQNIRVIRGSLLSFDKRVCPFVCIRRYFSLSYLCGLNCACA